MNRAIEGLRLAVSLALATAATALSQVPMARPVSVAWHQATDAWYVADLGPEAETGGWIARLDRRDRRAQPRWLTGLKSPRALAASGNHLYVADGDSVAVVDAVRAVIVARHRIEGARLLGGVAVGADGEIYASDTPSSTLHRVSRDGKSSVLVRGGSLEGPAGLFIDGDEILVANRGAPGGPGALETKGPGHLAAVDLRTGKLRKLGPPAEGRFESILGIRDAYVVSDSAEGTVKKIGRSGEVRILSRNLKGVGGLGLDPVRGLVAVPEIGSRGVLFVALP